MISYRAPAYRPMIASAPFSRPVQHHQLGSLSSMTAGDWLLLLGGAIVGGVGVNMVIGSFKPSLNAVSLLLGAVLGGVGLTLFVQKGGKALSSAP